MPFCPKRRSLGILGFSFFFEKKKEIKKIIIKIKKKKEGNRGG
jgi:hypothetical protein